MLSTAIFGRSDRIRMVQVPQSMVSKSLATNKIDVMIGGLPYSATNEISSRAAPVAPVYYDHMTFLARDPGEAKSMQDFKGQKVCIVQDTDDINRLQAYNNHYQLDLQFAPYKNMAQVRENFLLQRCRLMVGNSMLLQDMLINTPAGLDGVEMLPEVIDERPFYLFVDKENTTLRTTVKWILNAVKLTEELGLTQENYSLNLGTKDPSMANLLGTDDKLWKSFKLEPTWVQTMLKERGNYGDIFEKSCGQNSAFKIKRGKNNLLKNGGLIFTEPFI